MTNDRLIGVDELASWLGVPKGTIYLYNHKGTGPRYVKFGRHVRYRQADVEAWLEEQEVANATSAA